MKLIHLTDTHITPFPDRLLFGLDPRKRLEDIVADINENHRDAELCVITGDLAHGGEPLAYAAFARLIQRLVPPTVLLIGNHDDRRSFQAQFPSALRDPHGFVQGVLPFPEASCFFLDTRGESPHAGRFCPIRQDWLRRTLDAIDGNILLFMHHPPFSVGISSMDAIALDDAEALAGILSPHRDRIRHLFLGHLHRPISGNWRGISFSVLPGTNHQVALDLEPHGLDIPGNDTAPAYAVALVESDRVVVHLRDFQECTARLFTLGKAEPWTRGEKTSPV